MISGPLENVTVAYQLLVFAVRKGVRRNVRAGGRKNLTARSSEMKSSLRRPRAIARGLALATVALMFTACRDTTSGPRWPTPGGPSLAEVTLGATTIVNGAQWNEAVAANVGTGNLNPFLDLQEKGSEDDNGAEEGFNTNGTFNYDQARTSFTNPLPLNYVPTISDGGTAYREFVLDANEPNTGNSPLFSIDRFDVWVCNDPAAPTYDDRTDFTANALCELAYTLNGDVLLATDGHTQGSGKTLDYQILVPEQGFIDTGFDLSSCSYAGTSAPACGLYIILDTKLGGKGGNYVVESGFEEYSTIQRPYVTVTKTAIGKFDRSWTWDIQKTTTDSSLILLTDEVYQAPYTVTMSPTSSDANYRVEGSITITNPTNDAITLESISDAIGGTPATLTCPNGTTNVVLAGNGTYTCTYTLSVTDGTAGTNTATVQIDIGPDFDGALYYGSAGFTFSSTPTVETDECVAVTDTYTGAGNNGALGTICASDQTKYFTYNRNISFSTCGDHTVDNTATSTTNDTQTTDNSSVTVNVHIDCLVGCTLTQGYWKTHNASFKGGANKNADVTWDALGSLKELTGFFTTTMSYPTTGLNVYGSTTTWFGVFWTKPQGNYYYNLADQYMAAKLNILSGADPTAVSSIIGPIETFFATYTPTSWPKTMKNQLTTWAGTLGSYNQGGIGPGHCSEDAVSVTGNQ
jgi:hypothetical protein